jgi:hypothetical protein
MTVMPTRLLARDVLIATAVKLTVVIAAALFVFGPGQRPKIDAGGVAARLIGAPDPQSKDVSP